jgi:hypothetical protein
MDVNYGAKRRTVEDYLNSLHHYGSIVTDGLRWYIPQNFPKKNLGDFILETRVKPVERDQR